MAPLRLRHPKGVSTLQVDFETSTVLDLQQAILAASDIPPSAQDRTHLSPPSFSSNEIVHYALCANQSKQATRPAPSPQSSLSFRSPASALPRASSSSSPRNQALLLLLRLPPPPTEQHLQSRLGPRYLPIPKPRLSTRPYHSRVRVQARLPAHSRTMLRLSAGT